MCGGGGGVASETGYHKSQGSEVHGWGGGGLGKKLKLALQCIYASF